MPVIFESDHSEATRAWAAQLAAEWRPPLVVALYGNLGAGKTVLAQGIAASLGVNERVTSPTFTLINEYELPAGGRLYHVDCYRLDNAEAEAIALGLDELFEQGIVLVEWADRIAAVLPPERIDIELSDAGPGRRLIVCHDRRPEPQAL
ncbi:MAG: tRNA (adenosine(37)-N6)-threonylcarbamoyltransferase complex ATPase subunit type 1 TsaE [Caldilineales bacterium]|nr:tRNA (adenosine(37)-N6)-threonylcarbamoyltransferase complex ATPase subunit type 1 TsaE [Caldilineales bacterium]